MGEHINPWEAAPLAQEYDAWFGTPLGALTDALETRLIMRLAAPKAGENALDVGTGTGHFAGLLHALGLEVSALDASPAMIEVARLKTREIAWHCNSAQALPFEDERFDLVMSITALEFMSEPALAIKEMIRVLKPGGRLILGVLNRQSSWAMSRDEQAAQIETPFAHARYYSASELISLLPPAELQWNSSVFYGPDGARPWWGRALESLGQTFCRNKGALIVLRWEKP